MLIDINRIVVGDRIRKDFGNIQELADDIAKNGLINPPTINKNYVLLAGERRLKACKSLGWTQIEVHMLDTKDEAHDLDVEMSENNMRRNFTGSELAEGIRRQMAIESEKANERMLAGKPSGNISLGSGQARDKAGAAFGISGKQAEKVVFVDDHRDLLDPADFAEWDEGKLSTNKAYQRIKAALNQANVEKRQANAARTQAENDRRRAEHERDVTRSALESANEDIRFLEGEVESLKNQPKPEPEVIEVFPEDYEDVKRDAESLRRDNERLTREYHDMWHKKQEADRKLDEANELLGEKSRMQGASRDIELLTIETNNYLRQYGGKALALDQFDLIDEVTRDEFTKAIVNLAGFAQNLVQMIQDRR